MPRPARPVSAGRIQGMIDAILRLYREGWFPMADPKTGVIQWYQPKKRGIIPLESDQFKVSRSLRQKVRRGVFSVRSDTAFREVITACSLPRPSEATSWINQTIIETYTLLQQAGHAHSVEAWTTSENGEERLVGGLYGVHIGGVFFGESMFSLPDLGGTDSSKVCLVHLVHHMRERGFKILDAQLWNPHLAQFGCREEPNGDFLARVGPALETPCVWSPFQPAMDTLR